MYSPTKWQDLVTEYEDRYTVTRNADGTQTHTPYPGEIIQQGTPQSATNFNHMELGIQDAALATAIWSAGFLIWQREADASTSALTATVERNAAATETALTATETAATDLAIATKIYALGDRYDQYHADEHEALIDAETLGELQEITLTNTQKIPFNSTMDSPRSVALRQVRKNLCYSVETEVLEHTGEVGAIQISGKALNGFKIAFTGSGTSVKLAVRIKGGMT